MKNDILKVLNEMHKKLSDPKKWIKGKYSDKEGAYDLIGTLYSTILIPDMVSTRCLVDVRESLTSTIKVLYDDNFASKTKFNADISIFNDDPNIRHEDILELIDVTIELVEDKYHKIEKKKREKEEENLYERESEAYNDIINNITKDLRISNDILVTTIESGIKNR